MKKIAVLGAGMIGSAIALDLANNFTVTIIDINKFSLDEIQKINSSIDTIHSDLLKLISFEELLEPFDFVITAVPGFMGYGIIKKVIEAGKNLVDISFFAEDPSSLNQVAIEKGVTVIVDCGVAPGMSNLLLGHYNKKMNISSFECLVGGLPKIRKKPFEYKAPFSPVDVIAEYTRPARFMENGKLVSKKALTDPELIEFANIGTLESFNTDGLRSLLYTMKHIPNMKEKTLRYPGHIQLIQSLMDSGFFSENPIIVNGIEISPLDFSSKILINEWKLGKDEEEFTIMKIKITGEENGIEKIITYNLHDKFDKSTHTSSMARTTGYTCNAVVNLIVNGTFSDKGVFPPEFIGATKGCADYVLTYLKERGVNYKIASEC